MKMKDFLSSIVEHTSKLQLNKDKKEYAVLLHIRGHIYGIKSIVMDPFNITYTIILIPYVSDFTISNFVSVDRIYYLNARKSLMFGMEDDIKFVLVDGNDTEYIPVGTVDIKEQTITNAKTQGVGTSVTNIIYHFS